MTLAKCAHFFGGAWRIRTAVDGFADRRLSHSSKAPCSLFASAKIRLLWGITKHLEAKIKYFPNFPSICKAKHISYPCTRIVFLLCRFLGGLKEI